jgi:RecA-family ATPase
MVSAEDDPADTIRPRLDAAGADPTRVHTLEMVHDVDSNGKPKARTFNLAKDIEALDRLLHKYPECRLITIDPISAYLGGTDSHNNADIRALLTPLAAMASRQKVAIVVVTHLNKSTQANALYRASGSLAFVAAARAVYSVVKDPDDPDRRLFLPIKNNLGDDKTGFGYTIETAENNAPVIEWEDELVEMTIEELADAVTDRKQRPYEKAMNWLEVLLSGGPILVERIKAAAENKGHSWSTVKRAKNALNVRSNKTRFDGKWEWQLPVNGRDVMYMGHIANSEGAH